MAGWAGWIMRLVYGTGGLVSVALGLLYFLQERLLYVPVIPGVPADYWISPERVGLAYEDVAITTEDGVKIHAWLLSSPKWTPEYKKSRPVVLFFQENAGNMSFRLPFLRLLIKHLGVSVFAVSYRGYGKSEGKPNEKGIRMDAEAGLKALKQRTDVDTSRIVVFGRSLGGAVAIYITSRHQNDIKALVVENTFTCVEDMASRILPPLGTIIGPGRPMNFLVTNKWKNIQQIRGIQTVPMQMLVSGRDEMVPPVHMKQLYAVQQAQHCEYKEFPEAGHMDAYDSDAEDYWYTMTTFFTKYVGPDGAVVTSLP